MEKLEFRQVSLEDYSDVMAIRGNLYSGLDYLPALYRNLLQSYTGYAAYIEQKMIAFVLAKVIDDGSTMLLRAGRVSPEHEGKGVYKRLTDFAEKEICRKYQPNAVVRKTYVVPRDSTRDTLLAKGATVSYQRRVIIACGQKCDLERRMVNSRNTLTQICDEGALMSTVMSDKLKHHLFPDDRIVVNSVPYRLSESNIKIIMASDVNIFVSKLDDSNLLPLLTCSNSYACTAGTRLNIDVFGCSDSQAEIWEHICRHLSVSFEKEVQTTVNLFITHNFQSGEDVLMSVLDKLSVTIDTSRPVVSVGIEEVI